MAHLPCFDVPDDIATVPGDVDVSVPSSMIEDAR